MTGEEKARLQSLIERIVPYRDGLYRLVGPIGSLELEALRAVVDEMPGVPLPPASIVESDPDLPHFELDKSLARRKKRPKGLLCIDFGTAASKAAFDLGNDEPKALALGARANDPDGVHWVNSTAAVTSDGLVLLGGPAEIFLRHSPTAPGIRSFKSKLWDNPEILDCSALSFKSLHFTFADCLLSYLAYLTRLISLELEAAGENRHMPRRYALPYAYDEVHANVRNLFGIMVGKAAVLADSLGDELLSGVPAPKLRAALDAMTDATVPTWLLDTNPACIGEPVAAGNFAMDEEIGKLTVYMIMDVGAGTTDFCILCLKKRRDGGFEPIQIKNGSHTVACAGDTLDQALANYVEETWGISDAERVLGVNMRALKENLFQAGMFARDLPDATPFSIDRDEFLKSRQWKEFVARLRKAQRTCLEQADQKYLRDFGGGAIRVVITGGGSALPLVGPMATGRAHGMTRTPGDALPIALRDHYALIVSELPRLVVSLGGSFNDIPLELDRTKAKTSLGFTPTPIWKPLDKTETGLTEDPD